MRNRATVPPAVMLSCVMCSSAALAGDSWVTFTNETSTRLAAPSTLVENDTEEKDYAWGDLDQDGRIDLVIVRKQPFSTPGRRANVLLMNEGLAEGHEVEGVLVDRTSEYASASTDGSAGFLDLTNDRDVIVIDLDGDGWLDVVTATAYGQGLSKTISHPRIYMNQGSTGGQWNGLLYDEPRMPVLQTEPNTCGVAGGDVTGDGMPDLYFVTYSSTFEDFLLVNDGAASFTDQSSAILPSGFRSSSFGTATEIEDMTENGWNDIVKSENGPVKIAYNSASGFFAWSTASSGAHYHVSVGDLNNNGRMDLIISDDGQDRVKLNQGAGGNGQVTFLTVNLPEQSQGFGGTGFGSNSLDVDLNNDGWNDVLIADVDVDIGGCSRYSNIYRNNANGPNVTFDRDLANIPQAMLQGVHDFAVFDVNGDGWNDIIVGRCSGTQVWMSQPPFSIQFTYPDGRPASLTPNQPTTLLVEIVPVGGIIETDSPTLHYAIDEGGFQAAALSAQGNDVYLATLPGIDCGATLQYYFSSELDDGPNFTDPPVAPNVTYSASAFDGLEVAFNDDMQDDVSGWTVTSDASLTGGEWEQAVPVGTIFNGNLAAPDGDASGNAGGQAFVTENCTLGQPAGQCDVDEGPTWLTSPNIDLSGGFNAVVRYDRWFFCSTPNDPLREDFLTVEISNDGGQTWVLVHEADGTDGEWETASFTVGDYVEPTGSVRVRFSTSDLGSSSITNAGIDNFIVEEAICGSPCTGDLDGSGTVDVFDLLSLLSDWGDCDGCDSDLDGDGAVNVFDLLTLLSGWGNCPD